METYVVYAPLTTPDYRLGVIVPASELNAAIVTSREEIQNEISSSLLTAIFILIGLLAGTIILSTGIGQVIKVHDLVIRVIFDKSADYVRANKTSSPGDQEFMAVFWRGVNPC